MGTDDGNERVIAALDAAQRNMTATLVEAWPAVEANLAAGRPDKAANVVRLGTELLWKMLLLWRLQQDIDADVWAGVEQAVVDIAARITERRAADAAGITGTN
jgi:hypothetical protein